MKATLSFALVLHALCAVCPVSAVTIDFVTIGNPGNAPDTRYGSFGSVDYVYRMGKYEVTAGQYTGFLNAVAVTDTFGLYNVVMSNPGAMPGAEVNGPTHGPSQYSFGANIQRTGNPGTYSYSVATDWANRPVNYVSFWDAARFANWLHNGQPSGSQNDTTTEDGAYDLDGYTGLGGWWITRNPGAKFFIPSEEEWYKAAYHKNDGVTGNYWDYPTGTNATPSNHLSNPQPDPGNSANYYENGFAIGSPYYRTEVGEFENSASPYGTFDQGGNVWEWTETIYLDSNERRVQRGGSHDLEDLLASTRDSNEVTEEYYHFGFRVASIPEPASLTSCATGFSMLILCRRNKSSNAIRKTPFSIQGGIHEYSI